MLNKVTSTAQAVGAIRDGDTLLVSGFVGIGTPDELIIALEKRFLETGHPRDLTVVFAAAPGDGGDKGLNRLAHEGLIKRAIGGHWSLVPKLAKMATDNKIEAYNLPLGCISQMYRVIAGGKPGLRTKVGLHTFVDPRIEGGKINECTTEDLVSLDVIDGEEWLFYKSFPINVAFLRGTTSDPFGNTTNEREVLKLDVSSQAMAVHNSNGVVLVQAERIAERGSLSPKRVLIPGNLVGAIVLSKPENHFQTYAHAYEHAFSSEMRVPLDQYEALPLNIRKVIARRAAMELPIGGVVNLGIGVPEGVAAVANEESLLDYVSLTAEAGTIGGVPQSGLDFGAALNPDAIVATNTQFDFYDGGGIDMACLGAAQVDQTGNVNVSKFGSRFAGAGGFINISQNAEKVVFAGSFTAGGLDIAVEDGQLNIIQEGKQSKFVEQVEHITFSGTHANNTNQGVMYVTERCVFRLSKQGLELVEIAPGVDLQKDILDLMAFKPIINEPLQIMDHRIFNDESMRLRGQLVDMPIKHRITLSQNKQELLVNLRGYEVNVPKDIELIVLRIEELCEPLGYKLHLDARFDGFVIKDKLKETFYEQVYDMETKYYKSSVRRTKDAFFRLSMAARLEKRGIHTKVEGNTVISGYIKGETEVHIRQQAG